MASTKQVLRGFLDKLSTAHYEQLGHAAYTVCGCEFAKVLREMSKAARDERGRKRQSLQVPGAGS